MGLLFIPGGLGTVRHEIGRVPGTLTFSELPVGRSLERALDQPL